MKKVKRLSTQQKLNSEKSNIKTIGVFELIGKAVRSGVTDTKLLKKYSNQVNRVREGFDKFLDLNNDLLKEAQDKIISNKQRIYKSSLKGSSTDELIKFLEVTAKRVKKPSSAKVLPKVIKFQ